MTSSRLLGSLATTDELAEIFADGSVLGEFLRFESALANGQARLGIIPEAAAQAISRCAIAELFDAEIIAREARASATFAIPIVKALTGRVAASDEMAARFVHWGATSQDALDTTMSLLLSRVQPILARDHARFEQALRSLSNEHAASVMLGRTVLQPAPPITFGYKVAGWFGSVHRIWRRLRVSLQEAAVLQFGGAAGTLAAYGEHGAALAAELAQELHLPVSQAPWHAHRDRIAALVVDAGIYTAALGKIARDLSLLMQHEVSEVAEAGGGSSAMPNKRNPAGSVLALAAATRLPGLVAGFLAAMVQEHERATGGWQAEWPILTAVIETTGSALAALVDTVNGLTVFPGRMRANIEATHGAIFAEKARLLLQPKMEREALQKLLAAAARQAIETARPFREVLRAQPHIASLLTAEQLESLDQPEDYLGRAEEFRKKLLEE